MAIHHILIHRFRFRLLFTTLVVICSITILALLFHLSTDIDPRRCYSGTFLDDEDQTDDDTAKNSNYKRLDDVLLADEKPTPGQSIFFHDTSCNRRATEALGNFLQPFSQVNLVHLTTRQACAIESAALHNPNYNVFVLFTKPAHIDNGSDVNSLVDTILTYPNVHLRNLNLWTYAAGTPMYGMLKEGKLFKSMYIESHTSDFLRYLTLWRWGGLYLDMDTVTLRSMEDLPPNYTGAESHRSLAAGVMNFSPTNFGHEIATLCLQDFLTNFNGKNWGNNGPGVITRVLHKICDTKHIALMINEPSRCRGFKVLDRKAFYAISYEDWEHFFDPYYLNSTLVQTQNSYVLHVWNNFSKKRTLQIGSESAYTKLAKKHCPRVYTNAGKYF